MKKVNAKFKRIRLWSLLIIAGLTVTVDSPLAQTSNWPQWRGNEGSGISAETNLPTEWSDTKTSNGLVFLVRAVKTNALMRSDSAPVAI